MYVTLQWSEEKAIWFYIFLIRRVLKKQNCLEKKTMQECVNLFTWGRENKLKVHVRGKALLSGS